MNSQPLNESCGQCRELVFINRRLMELIARITGGPEADRALAQIKQEYIDKQGINNNLGIEPPMDSELPSPSALYPESRALDLPHPCLSQHTSPIASDPFISIPSQPVSPLPDSPPSSPINIMQSLDEMSSLIHSLSPPKDHSPPLFSPPSSSSPSFPKRATLGDVTNIPPPPVPTKSACATTTCGDCGLVLYKKNLSRHRRRLHNNNK